jgi:hypothetical protein
MKASHPSAPAIPAEGWWPPNLADMDARARKHPAACNALWRVHAPLGDWSDSSSAHRHRSSRRRRPACGFLATLSPYATTNACDLRAFGLELYRLHNHALRPRPKREFRDLPPIDPV